MSIQDEHRADPLDQDPAPTARLARAVLYLRVSTKDQAERGGEAEGFSLPAQRDACTRKATSLGAEVVEEFADRGESAKTADRPELLRLLEYLREERPDFVIVHKVDRLARNRADDVAITLAIRQAGVTLVSCTENIDETPSGALMHGIMSSIAEFYSRNLAAEVIKGSTQKAKSGGTVGKAPTGYLNVRHWDNGRENRTVEVDPVRGPLMQWVFQQYATGEWSIRRLLEAATEKGLTSKGGPRTPSKPLSLSNFCRLLGTSYYYGVFSYRGVQYQGTHEPLITKATFDKVQEVLRAHAVSGEKRRLHHHHLIGTVYCRQCGSRLGVMKAKNRYGTIYPYFYCLGKQEHRTACTQRTVRIEQVEERVALLWQHERLSEPEREQLEAFIRSELAGLDETNRSERTRQATRVAHLKAERQKLLQAHYADALPLDLMKSEQQRIASELASAEGLLDRATAQMTKVALAVSRALDLVTESARTYREAPSQQQRMMNQALYSKILVGDDGTIEGQYTKEYELLLDPSIRDLAQQDGSGQPVASPEPPNTGSDDVLALIREVACVRNARTPAFAGRGSRNDYLVGEGGLEPPHSFLY